MSELYNKLLCRIKNVYLRILEVDYLSNQPRQSRL